MSEDSAEVISQWTAVIARSLAFLCLTGADLRDKDLATQARFLEGLGLSRKDCATLLDSTENSIAVALSRTKRRPARGRDKKSKAQ